MKRRLDTERSDSLCGLSKVTSDSMLDTCANHMYGEENLSYSCRHMSYTNTYIHYAGCHGPHGGSDTGLHLDLKKFLHCLNFLNLDIVPQGFSLEFSAHKMPISVYMCDKMSGNLKVIAEYGQEYGKENPIRVLFHSYGHYDSLKAPCN
uniref:OTU domain-containing protein n=1 Tax=Cucumis melo TaxID=3656 RepID=A0A9I9D2J1_CUCME